MNRKLQIGVMGSAADLGYEKKIERLAEELGAEIAKAGAILIFGAEKGIDSLSSCACRGAKKAGGLAVGITWGKTKDVYEKGADVIIPTGLEIGGGREFTLVLACDAIICLSGGSGTLNEIAVAYQANIPVVVIKGTGGWSGKLENQYLDDRNRFKIISAPDPKSAVKTALKLAKSRTK